MKPRNPFVTKSQRRAICNRSSAAALGFCGLLTAGQAFAADKTWSGLDIDDDNWSSSDNWSAAIVADDRPVFDGSTRLTPNNDFAVDTNFAGILFRACPRFHDFPNDFQKLFS